MKKYLSIILIICMMVTLMAPCATFASGGTAAVQELVTNSTASELANKTAVTTAINTANTSTPSMAVLFGPAAAILASEPTVISAYSSAGHSANLSEESVKFISALALLEYADSVASLNSAISYFDGISAADTSFKNVLFPTLTNANFIDLFMGMYSNIGTAATGMSDAQILTLASASVTGDAQTVLTAMKSLFAQVYDAQADALGLSNQLLQYGWDGTKLVNTLNRLRDDLNTATSGKATASDIATVNAIIRTEAVINGTKALSVGGSQAYTFTLFGRTTNFGVKYYTSGSAGSITTGGTYTASAVGTSTVYVYRVNETVTTPGQEGYIASFAVTVSAASSSSSSGGGGGAPAAPAATTPPPTTDAAQAAAGTALQSSQNVQSEAQATAVAATVNTAAATLSSTMDAAVTSTEKAAVMSSISNLSQAISNASQAVTTQAGAQQVIDSTKTLLTNTAAVTAKAETAAQVKTLVNDTSSMVTNTATMISKFTDSVAAQSMAKDVITSAGAIVKAAAGNAVTAGGVNKDIKQVEAQVREMAQAAVTVAGTQTIAKESVKVNAATGIGSVAVSSADLAAKAQASVAARVEMNASITAAGMARAKQIQTSVVVSVPAVEGVKTVEASLAGLNAVFAVVDKVNVETPTANFEIDKNSFGKNLTETVKMSAENVATSSLTPAQAAQVPAGSNVIDLNASVGAEKVSSFKTPITVAVPYVLAAGENPQKLTVFLLKDDGTIESVPAKYEDGKVTFKRKSFSLYFVKQNNKSFNDMNDAAWATNAVEYLAAKGIVNGTSQTSFTPNASVTRAEFLTMLMKIAQLNGDVKALPFTDVDTTSWYAASVAAAYENAIVNGTSPVTFDPNAPIIRQDMAVMISKVMTANGYYAGDVKGLSAFKDADAIASYAKGASALVSGEGVINGTPEGNFNPTANATRAEAATMLYNYFNK